MISTDTPKPDTLIVTRVMGLDLGQTSDKSAAAVVERTRDDPVLRCVSLRTWPNGTSYVDVVRDVLDLPCDVYVPDACGVGRPVVDLLNSEITRRFSGVPMSKDRKVRPVITVGSDVRTTRTKVERTGLYYSVPKVELVTSLIVLQQQDLLRLPATIDAKQLIKELSEYQRRTKQETGSVQYGNKPGKGNHDDLISALALACWYSMRFGVKQLAVYMP